MNLYSKKFCDKIGIKIAELKNFPEQVEYLVSRLEAFDSSRDNLDQILLNVNKVEGQKKSTILNLYRYLCEDIVQELETLKKSGEIIFHSPEVLQELFMKAEIEIPIKEMLRMCSRLVNLDIAEVKEKCSLLKDHTFHDHPSLLMSLPRKLIIHGEEIDCTLENFNVIAKEFRERNIYFPRLKLKDLSYEIMTRVWSNHFRAYTTHYINKSNEKSYLDQRKLVTKLLGKNAEIRLEAVPAMILDYAIRGNDFAERGMRCLPFMEDRDVLRIDEEVENGRTLEIYYSNGIKLEGRTLGPNFSVGIGASFEFKPTGIY